MPPASRHSLSLSEVDSARWYDNLGKGSHAFQELGAVLGKPFVAFAMIAGFRIVSLTIDKSMVEASRIEFRVADDEESHTLSLADFRECVVTVLGHPVETPAWSVDNLAPSLFDIQAWLGVRIILLASVFGWEFRQLHLEPPHAPRIELWHGPSERLHELTRAELWAQLYDALHTLLAKRQSPTQHTLDLEELGQAQRDWQAGNAEAVIDRLHNWPQLLLFALRTGQAEGLDATAKDAIVKGLQWLAQSYWQCDQDAKGEEVLRLAIQWGHEGAYAGELYFHLGQHFAHKERFGEAIGLLRRALFLGADVAEVMPVLAQAFAQRERYVAAAMCLDQALAAGASSESLNELQTLLKNKMGEAWNDSRAHVPVPW